jgi:serine-type D-Ala-D-Ala carboxypeptidase (penicillin-binding protein 5/6)
MMKLQDDFRARIRMAIGVFSLVASGWLGPQDLSAADSLAERIGPLIDAHEGLVGVAVRHLDPEQQFAGGSAFSHRADEPMPTASLIKFPVMIETYRQAAAGRVDLTRPVVLQQADKVPGSGILTSHFSDGASFPLRDAVRLMIAFSDNTGTNLVLDQIGLDATAKYMEELECPNTKIHSKVYKRETSVFPERSKQFGLGSTTAGEMLRLVDLLHQRKLVSPEASDAMKEHLLACDDKKKFPRLLPASVKVAHKTGSVDAVRTDAGIIYSPAGPIAVCVLTNNNKDTRWTDENAGDLLCARIALAVYEHFNPPAAVPAGKEKTELDRPLRPEIQLALARSGGDEENDSEPEVSLPELQPRDALSGPPFTACRSWAVAESRSGKILWESHAGDTCDTASTTKIMTAYVVLKLAEEQPQVLDEPVVFSDRADKTAGSSSGVHTGERIPVRELLYGLLLPSGNDAAVAIAEHFGGRFDPPSRGSQSDPVARFVAEMNRTAAKLKLTETKYQNPNGLPEKGHASSARDLVRVTFAAVQLPLFREYVSSRLHESRATARDGSQRLVTWKTTNRLLGISGYTGVKTGYTRAAGSCLVSTGERGRDGLIVVVLGAPSAAAAVADSRNLYRFAWSERGQKD